jgi:hypothetical protein
MKEVLAMPKQEYIKYLYEKEEESISKISARVGMNWRTAAKYAKKDNWNTPTEKAPDRVEIFNRSQERIAVFPRTYTAKAKPIDWKG